MKTTKRNSTFTHVGTVELPHNGTHVNCFEEKLFVSSDRQFWIGEHLVFHVDTGNRVNGLRGRLLLETIKPIEEAKP